MKKINYKKEYLREFNLRCDLQDANKEMKKAYLFWMPLGIIGIIIMVGFLAWFFVKISEVPPYIITQAECHNDTDIYGGCVLGCGTGIIGSTNQYNLSTALYICENICQRTITQVCINSSVENMVYVNRDCISHSPNEEYSLLNCFTTITKKDINLDWLRIYCECEHASCPDSRLKECSYVTEKDMEKHCAAWRCQGYEVSYYNE